MSADFCWLANLLNTICFVLQSEQFCDMHVGALQMDISRQSFAPLQIDEAMKDFTTR